MTTTSTTPVRSLLEGARAGDEAAWSGIVTEIGPTIRGYARARGVRDAEDLTQDVFMAAAARIGDFEGDERAFRSWLFGIAYRQIVNRYRASARQTAPLPATLPDTNGSPEDQVVGAFEASEAVAALDVLGEVERDVVLMRVVGGLDTADVAAAVGKHPGNVRVIQSRAMDKLREELKRRGYGAAGVWAAALVADVVGPIGAARASVVAGAASSAVGSGTVAAGAAAAGTAVGASTAAKVAAAVVLVVSVGGGTAAVTGSLPDPAQTWVSDVARRVGVSLPHPVDTTIPTLDPTLDPVLDPVLDPTLDPVLDPVLDPTLDPTLDPVLDPVLDPTLDDDGAIGDVLPGVTTTVPSTGDIGGAVDLDTSPLDDTLEVVDPFVPIDPQGVDVTLPLP
jgi:RNA polymerase sigma-70 factor, ECF subfamily